VCSSADRALDLLEATGFDIMVAEQDLEIEGRSLLSRAADLRTDLAIILTTGFGTIETAVSAMRQGAFDYLSKPIVPEELRLSVQRSLEQRALVAENSKLKAQLTRHRQLDGILGSSAKMTAIFEVVESVAPTRATVLITGASGTGKSVMARVIHNRSSCKDGPFLEVNCGALPDTLLESELFGHARGSFTGAIRDTAGKFEQADGGTLFLDEIATASPALQVKLLRVIQSRKFERVGETKTRRVDVRLILATNQNLLEMVSDGEFREDLYYRINVVNIEIPELKERVEDIPFLLDHFLRHFADYHSKPVTGFGPEALDHLLSYPWPGNIRELENTVERAVVLSRSPTIELRDLPPGIAQQDRPVVQLRTEILPLKKALEEPEKLIIRQALELNHWNRQKTADMLEVNRTTLFHKMKKYGLLPPKGPDSPQ